ncbi:IclR family transcriptional regulator C-terminal domain-containing protein [Streptomyces sp. NPDC021354]|uniref:IclR family transcriptional regulator domain-containing protein n=1 Tax=Streptomyces sp. NPDC021354 TaxID=3154793 RepID=UPI00340B0978
MSLRAASPPVNGSVGPLERGLAVLRELAALSALSAHGAGTAVRPGDLVRATGLARSVVDRVLGTLEQLGYVRLDGREVSLATRLMELGNAYLNASGLPDALLPFAGRLADALDESVSVAVPDGAGVRFVVQVTRRRTMSLAFRIGDLLPAERCAPGALFATQWDEATWAAWRARRAADPLDASFPAVPPRPERDGAPGPGTPDPGDFARRVEAAGRGGWAPDDQLIEPGLVAVSVPLRDPAGRIVCAVNVVSHTSRHDIASLGRTALAALRDLVPAMEAALAAPAAGGPGAKPGAEPPPAGGGVVGEDPARLAKREMGAGFLQSLARGLAVLRALGSAAPPGPGPEPGPGLPARSGLRQGVTLTAVAEATGLARATARRSLLTLLELGYAETDGERLFRPTPRVLELGHAPLAGLGFNDIARPHMRELVGAVHESASLAVLDGDDIRYVERVPTVRIMSVNITIGTRFPAYATSLGRVLLAGLDPDARAAYLAALDPRPLTRHTLTSAPGLARVLEGVAESGYALADEELEEGLRSLAVPVRDAEGRVAAALNLAVHAGRGTPEDTVRTLLPPLRAAAARVEADLRTASAHRPHGLGARRPTGV